MILLWHMAHAEKYHQTDIKLDLNKDRTRYLVNCIIKKKNFMAPFYGWGSTASRLEPLQGGSLLFTTIIN